MALYTELWRACAGPLVTVPREHELVFYFPQGHIEQVFCVSPNYFLTICFDFSSILAVAVDALMVISSE